MAPTLKADLQRELRELARLETDTMRARQLRDDADTITLGRGRLSARHVALARKMGLLRDTTTAGATAA